MVDLVNINTGVGLEIQHNGNLVSEMGLVYENSTSEQIVAATKEMIGKVGNQKPKLDEADSLLQRYQSEFLPQISGSNISTLPSRDFIVCNKDLYFLPKS